LRKGLIIAEPAHDGAGVWLEIVVVIAVEERFKDRCSHDGLARTRSSRERKGVVLVAVFVPALAGFLEPV